MGTDGFILLVEQTELEEYKLWYKALVEESISICGNNPQFCLNEITRKYHYGNNILSVARRWNVDWQSLKVAADLGRLKLSKYFEYSISEGKTYIRIAKVGISDEEIERIERENPELKMRYEAVCNQEIKDRHAMIRKKMIALQNFAVAIAQRIHPDYLSIIENDQLIDKANSVDTSFDLKAKEKCAAVLFLTKYVLNDKEYLNNETKELLEVAQIIPCELSGKNNTGNVEIDLPKIKQTRHIKENASKTTNAHIGNLKKRIQELTEGYEGAAKLAHTITKNGPQRGVNPWTEEEIVDLAGKLDVSIKGDCLKAFKAGMPADLVKKDAGARPITPREESPDDVES